MTEKRLQKAGDHAQQVQVSGNYYLVQGVTEERAREIADEAAHQVIAQYSDEANAIGLERIGRFDEELVRRLTTDGLLGAFADPGFLVLLRKAQLGAASTERVSDYDMLAALLADRVSRGTERTVRAGINRAVEIVDQLDEASLSALTVLSAAVQYRPASGFVAQGLDRLNELFGQLIPDELPNGTDWIDHLDVLDAVRLIDVGSLMKFHEYLPSIVPGYVAAGVEEDSDSDRSARAEFASMGFENPVVSHEFRPGYARMAISYPEQVETGLDEISRLTVEQKQRIMEVIRETYGLGTIDRSLVPALMEAVEARPNLNTLKTWWDQIPVSVQLTAVGRVLARANAERLDALRLLPPLT